MVQIELPTEDYLKSIKLLTPDEYEDFIKNKTLTE
jgi:hypothetical protein